MFATFLLSVPAFPVKCSGKKCHALCDGIYVAFIPAHVEGRGSVCWREEGCQVRNAATLLRPVYVKTRGRRVSRLFSLSLHVESIKVCCSIIDDIK